MRIPAEVAAILAKVARERAAACTACRLRAPVEGDLCAPCGVAARELTAEWAEEKKFWAGQPKPERTPEPEPVEPEPRPAAERTTPGCPKPSRGEPSIPQQDPDDIAVSVAIHNTIRHYGRSLVSGNDSVAALRHLEATAATIPPVDWYRVYADTWARFAQHQLPAYAAIVLAHRLLNDRRIGRQVLKHLLASRVVLAPLGPGDGWRHHMLDTSSIWKELAEAAWHSLFNYDEAARFDTRGSIVKNVLGRYLQIGRGASVGLRPWQRRELSQLADPSRAKRAERPTAIFTTPEAAIVLEAIDAALELFARRWAKRHDQSDRSPAELLELAIRGKLDTAGVAVTEEVVRRIKRDAKKQRNTIHVDAQDLVDGGDAEQFLAALVEQSADRDHLLGLQDIMALDDLQAREAAIRRADPALRRFIVQAVRMMETWALDRDPTVEETARELGKSTRYVEELRRRGRDLVAPVDEAQPAARQTPRTPPPPSWYREDVRERFRAIVARTDKLLLAAQDRRRRRKHAAHEWVPDGERGAAYYGCECGVVGRKDLMTGQIRVRSPRMVAAYDKEQAQILRARQMP